MKKNKQYFVYILECENGSYYTGYTTDLDKRFKAHCNGTAKCRYTRSFPPKRIAAAWEFDNLSDALAIEREIKQRSRQEKTELIKNQ